MELWNNSEQPNKNEDDDELLIKTFCRLNVHIVKNPIHNKEDLHRNTLKSSKGSLYII